MASTALCHAELDFVQKRVSALAGIELITVKQEDSRFVVTVVTSEKDYALEDKIFDVKIAALETFPDAGFDFRIFVRRGRALSDVVQMEPENIVYKKSA